MAEASEFQDDPGFDLTPIDDVDVSAEDELDAAVASALEDPASIVDDPDPPIPFGRSWQFDRERGRFVRVGSTPLEVRGEGALIEWLLNAAHTAAGVHPSVEPEFGLEDPQDVIGVADPTEAVADWQDKLRAAFLIHDRVAAVDPLEVSWDPSTGTVTLERCDVVTDEAEAVALLNVPFAPEV